MTRPLLQLARLTSILLLVVFGVPRASSAADANLADLIEKVEPAVVRIDMDTKQGKGVGSGFVVDSSGIVVTNHHVMSGATSAKVTFKDGETANVLGTLYLDSKRDIAVIKIDKEAKTVLPLATVLPRKGESVVAIGAPMGLSFSASQGIVAAVRQASEMGEEMANHRGTWIQTTAAISPGNSGGPLVDSEGSVVGANTLGSRGGVQNLNFSISCVDIADALKSAKSNKVVALQEGAAKAKTAELKHTDEVAAANLPSDKLATFVKGGQTNRAARMGEMRKRLREYRETASAMKKGMISAIGQEAAAAGHECMVIAAGNDKTYHFPDEATKARCIKRYQKIIDRGDEQLKKMDDSSAGFLTYLLRLGPELEPESVGDIGCVPDLEVLKIIDEDEFYAWVGDKPVVIRGMKTKELATGSTLDGRAMYIAGTVSYQAKGGGSHNVFVLRELPEDVLAPHIPAATASAAAKPNTAKAKAAPSTNAAATKEVAKVAAPVAKEKPATEAVKDDGYRMWTDTSGKFKVEAQLVTKVDDTVVLKRRDNGKVLTIPIATLSQADQDFLSKQGATAKKP